MDAKGVKRSVKMWTTTFYKSFLKNILLYISSRLSKIHSVHTYVMPRTVYFGWICNCQTKFIHSFNIVTVADENLTQVVRRGHLDAAAVLAHGSPQRPIGWRHRWTKLKCFPIRHLTNQWGREQMSLLIEIVSIYQPAFKLLKCVKKCASHMHLKFFEKIWRGLWIILFLP